MPNNTIYWPGSRWWNCDFHVHTPASHDFQSSPTAEDWVRAAIQNGLHVVAATDHNTGDWIFRLQQACVSLGSPLVVFPAVELTVGSGIHLLAIFDVTRGGDSVTALLGAASISDIQKGKDTACSPLSLVDAMKAASERGALCVLAHATDQNGCLNKEGPGQTLIQDLTSKHLHAIEINNPNADLEKYIDGSMSAYVRDHGVLAVLRGSDAHSIADIGSKSTWIKMSRPTLDGLCLAFADGGMSVVPADDPDFNPNTYAETIIESVEVLKAKYIGQKLPFVLNLNPWLNCIIGGRGTGKSSLVEFLRIALDRETEIPRRLLQDFQEFKKVPASRDDQGLLTDETEITVVYRKADSRFRAHWRQVDDKRTLEVQSGDGTWTAADGTITQRLPVRLFSQKQVFELASSPESLLSIVDDSPTVKFSDWSAEWNTLETLFLELRAKARTLRVTLQEESRLRGESDDIARKLTVYEKADHGALVQRQQRFDLQSKHLASWSSPTRSLLTNVRTLLDNHTVLSLSDETFSDENSDEAGIKAIITEGNDLISQSIAALEAVVSEMSTALSTIEQNIDNASWAKAKAQADEKYQVFVEKLAEAGVGNPDEYKALVVRKKELDERLAHLEQVRSELIEAEKQAEDAKKDVYKHRQDLITRRISFLNEVISDNPHVQMAVRPYGDMFAAEAQFRHLINKEGSLFQSDICSDNMTTGLIPDLYANYDMDKPDVVEAALAKVRQSLCAIHLKQPSTLTIRDQRFANYIQTLQPEALDRLEIWFPPDTLQVRYRSNTPNADFKPIEQGSPGQKTAAILAFLLSYGTEPIILDQPEDDLDGHLIYDLIVTQLRSNKLRRQLVVVTHNANIVVNGDAEYVVSLDVRRGQTRIHKHGGLQERDVRDEICRVMEGGRVAFENRYRRIMGIALPRT